MKSFKTVRQEIITKRINRLVERQQNAKLKNSEVKVVPNSYLVAFLKFYSNRILRAILDIILAIISYQVFYTVAYQMAYYFTVNKAKASEGLISSQFVEWLIVVTGIISAVAIMHIVKLGWKFKNRRKYYLDLDLETFLDKPSHVEKSEKPKKVTTNEKRNAKRKR